VNEEDPELANLQALAEKQDRQDGLASKPKAQTKQREVSVVFLESLGGEVIEYKIGDGKAKIVEIRFGSEEETVIFRPETEVIFQRSKDRNVRHGRLKRLFSRWKVSLKGNASRYDAQRVLNRANRWLWDKGEEKDEEEGEPSLPFKAVRQLLACQAEMEAKDAAETEVKDAAYVYPKPELETVTEERDIAEEQLNTVSYQLAMARDAISLTVEALSERLAEKVQMSFDLLQGDTRWPQDIDELQKHAVRLAISLQRPPTKAELRKRHNPSGTLRESEFSPLLKHAGLSWLKRGRGSVQNVI
jgi:hypothetical protein